MSGPPSKKWKGENKAEDLDDSFDEDDEILDGPSERFHELMTQQTQRVTRVQSQVSTVLHSTPPTVSTGRTALSPGQTALRTTPTSTRLRLSAFSSSRSAANTPTSSYESPNSVSQGEFIAIKFKLGNEIREKEKFKSECLKLQEENTAEKKRMEEERQKEIRMYKEKLKMKEAEVQSLQIANASARAETSMLAGDLNQSMLSVSSSGMSQRANAARQTHALPRFSAGNGFRADLAATFAHSQSTAMDEEMSFQDVPSQAFDTPNTFDTASILNRIPSPIQEKVEKVETHDCKLQTDLNSEEMWLKIPSYTQYIQASISTVASSFQLDDELYSLLEKIAKNPLEPEIIEIGDSQFSPLCSQEDISDDIPI